LTWCFLANCSGFQPTPVNRADLYDDYDQISARPFVSAQVYRQRRLNYSNAVAAAGSAIVACRHGELPPPAQFQVTTIFLRKSSLIMDGFAKTDAKSWN
jgi:hypothetical protein